MRDQVLRAAIDPQNIWAVLAECLQEKNGAIPVLTTAMVIDLHRIYGDAWASRLLDLVIEHKAVVGVHADDETFFIAPPSWSSKKLKGYVVARKDALEEEFGIIESMRSRET